MKGFTFVEILIVLTIYSLVLILVLPKFRYSNLELYSTINRLIFSLGEKANKTGKTITVYANKGVVKTSLGEIYELKDIDKGFCIIKPIFKPYYCYFVFTEGKKIVFTPLGGFYYDEKNK